MYSVFVSQRPVRIAFLVNPQGDDWPEQLDAVWRYTLEKWGGRFNTIVPTDGSEVEAGWWEFLKDTDPDYVIATTALSDALIERITKPLCTESAEVVLRTESPTQG